MKISILSVACCNPAESAEDQSYAAKVEEALAESGIVAEVSILTISEAIYSLEADKVNALMPIWKRYGAAMVPAMLINNELVLYGGVPTKMKIVEAISKHNNISQRTKENGK